MKGYWVVAVQDVIKPNTWEQDSYLRPMDFKNLCKMTKIVSDNFLLYL